MIAAPLIVSSRAFAFTAADEELSAAFRRHFEFSAGFREKFKSGTYRVPKGSSDAALVDGALNALQERLASLPEPTLAVIHHIDRKGHLRAWLVSEQGIEAGHATSDPYTDLSFLRSALRVDSRMQTRAPRDRNGTPIVLPSSDEGAVEFGANAALAHAAQQLLGDEILRVLADFSGRLIVLPVADTGTAPYAALPLGNGSRLVDKIATLIVPDIETLIDPGRTFSMDDLDTSDPLVFGNPDLSYDPDYIFVDLPGAEQEARAVGELIGARASGLRIGPRASLDAFLKRAGRPGGPELIHIASHAISNSVNPMDGSFVGLSRGRLTGQILRGDRFAFWAVRHPIVLLSGCQTALGKVFAGGTYGLSRAFYAAGAAQVLSSLWNVGDEATSLLMTETADKLYFGYPAEFALQRAQKKAFGAFGNDYAAWASFNAYGFPGSKRGFRA